MRRGDLIVKTKLASPRPQKRTLPRPRLERRIAQAAEYPLTILQAGAGYGKSTLLTLMAQTDAPLVWYHLSQEDADPLTFLNHLLAGFRQTFPELPNAANAFLETWE